MNVERVLLVVHPSRPMALEMAAACARGLTERGIAVTTLHEAPQGLDVSRAHETAPIDLVVVFGGDGSILRGSDIAHAHDVPLLGSISGTWGSWPNSMKRKPRRSSTTSPRVTSSSRKG